MLKFLVIKRCVQSAITLLARNAKHILILLSWIYNERWQQALSSSRVTSFQDAGDQTPQWESQAGLSVMPVKMCTG